MSLCKFERDVKLSYLLWLHCGHGRRILCKKGCRMQYDAGNARCISPCTCTLWGSRAGRPAGLPPIAELQQKEKKVEVAEPHQFLRLFAIRNKIWCRIDCRHFPLNEELGQCSITRIYWQKKQDRAECSWGGRTGSLQGCWQSTGARICPLWRSAGADLVAVGLLCAKKVWRPQLCV
jgi:hypothetical protein